MGLRDISYAPNLNYRMSREWRAWLKGWRRGQQELKARRAAEKERLEAIANG